MISMTSDEMVEVLAKFPELKCEGSRIHFVDVQSQSVRIDLRVDEPHQLVYLARLVAHLWYEERDFDGGYLWITQWDVWNNQTEAIGFTTLEQFRRGDGEDRSLEAAPGHHFRRDEFTEAVCCLLPPMLVGWDACFVPKWTHGELDYFVAVSHDSMMNIEVRTHDAYEKAIGILKGLGWIKLSPRS